MKLVIFDLDGVIVSTDKYHYQAWKSLADEYNFIFSEEINHMLRGVSRAESLKIILDVNGRAIEPEEFAAMLEKKNSIYKRSLADLKEEDILPGVLDLLTDLNKHNIMVAIGSSSKNTPLILKQIGLSESFDIIVDGNCITKSKPDPEVFLKGAEGLGIAPSDCVVYEDAEAGIEAALAAGMYAIGVGEHHLKHADYMTDSMTGESYETILKRFGGK